MKKGALTLFSQSTFEGIKVSVLDEAGKKCSDFSVLIEDKMLHTKEGENFVTLEYPASIRTLDLIICLEDYAELVKL